MICDRHHEVIEKQQDHEKRISKLELSDATMNEKLIKLFKKIDELTGWIKALVFVSSTTLLGFFIWSIQNIIGG